MSDEYKILDGISKYPIFHNKLYEDEIKNREPTESNIKELLKELITSLNILKKELSIIITQNQHNIINQSQEYKINIKLYPILVDLVIQLSFIITSKVLKNDEEFQITENIKNLDDIQNFLKFNEDQIKKESNNFLEEERLKERINTLLKYCEEVKEINKDYGIILINDVLTFVIYYLKEIKCQINLFKNLSLIENKYTQDDEMILLNLIYMLEKMDSILIFLSGSYRENKEDIFNQKDGSPDWQSLSKIVKRVLLSKNDEIQLNFKKESINTEKIVCTILNSYNPESYNLTNFSKFLYNYARYSNEKTLLYESKKILFQLNKNVTNEIMQMVRMPFLKNLSEKYYPSITFRKKMYLKKEYPDITLDIIQKLLKKMGNNSIDVSKIPQKIVYSTKEDILNNKNINQNELYSNNVPKNLKKYYVNTILIHNSFITFPEMKETWSYYFMSYLYPTKENSTRDTIMIFIHGGGFVGMCTHSHEIFLRDWSNILQIPIISINYKLSPEYKYPYGLNDCYQAYRWIIDHCEKIIGIKPKKIILAGDSSGGTFVLSLTFLIIALNEFQNEKIRLPDFVIPLYPCCNTTIKGMNLSLLLSLKDFLLNDKFLTYVSDAYRGNYDNDDDPFLNPVKAKDIILKKFPKARWHLATCDPLRDDNLRLLFKMSKIKGLDIMVYEFQDYNHGWNGMKNDFLTKIPTDILLKELDEFIEKNDE